MILRSAINYIHERISKNAEYSQYNIIVLGLIGMLGHPLYWAIWTYVFPQPYDSALIRFSAALICFVFLLHKYIPPKAKSFFPLYWFLGVSYVLPFLFTVHLIKNNFSDIWLMCEIAMIFMVATFIPNFILMFLNVSIGVVAGIFYCIFINTSYYSGANLDPFVINYFPGIEYVPIFLFGLTAGFVFSYAGVLGVKAVEKINIAKSLAGSIAHELRNPLSSIRLSASAISIDENNTNLNKLNKLSKQELVNLLISHTKEIVDHKEHLNNSIDLANSIIDLTLADLSGKEINKKDFSYHKSQEIIDEALKLYSFTSIEERSRVKTQLKRSSSHNFIFKGIDTAFFYILFNLIKNSLYYVKDRPKLTVNISSSVSSGKKILAADNSLNLDPKTRYNIIHIHDTGPGIASEVIDKLFGNFITSGKKEGTGLGLAFCKRTMINFGGDINCQSEFGQWTRFNLYFPQLSTQELKQADNYFKNLNLISPFRDNSQNIIKKDIISKKVLIVDDQQLNINIIRKIIKSFLPNSTIDSASDGKEALSLIKKSNKEKYDLIITDIQMPNMDGFELTKEIRKFDDITPISAYTSRTSYKIKQQAIDIGIDDYIIKPIPNNGLLKVIYKWLINDHLHSYEIEKIKSSFKGLKLIIADDEKINIMVLKKFLTNFGIEVEEVYDGAQLLEKYKSQFSNKSLQKFSKNNNSYYQDPVLRNKFDIIVADINMPNMDGAESAKAIRNFELIYNIQNRAIIIANSGDCEEKKIKSMLKYGMDDYFLKGENNSKLLQTIYFWLNYHKNKQSIKYSNNTRQQIAHCEKYKLINSKLSIEELKEYKTLFADSTKDLMEKIIKSKKNKNIEELAFHSHALKGISGNIGAEKLFQHISMVNNYAKKGFWPKHENWNSELEKIVQRTLAKFASL